MALTGNASFCGSLFRAKRAVAALILTSLAVGLSACSLTPKDVWVYVDNAGEERLEITVDERPAVFAAPGEFANLADG